MNNIKIMVNFETKKVVHADFHAGSLEYQTLVRDGYEEVGVVKHGGACPIFFYWKAEYFDPTAKYLRIDPPEEKSQWY